VRQACLALLAIAAPLVAAGTLATPPLAPRGAAAGRPRSAMSMHLRGGSDPLAVTAKPTAPIDGQKPGTSGLRKKTKEFMTENYLANFVQSVFTSLEEVKTPMQGGTLVISGDGRYFNRDAVQIIAKIAVAHGVSKLWIGQGGLLSTPAASAVVRARDGGFKSFGAFILSASHNPGGIDEDFGIKYNCENGGPAPEKVTDMIYEKTTTIAEIKSAEDFPAIDIDTVGVTEVKGADGKTVTVEVFDCTEDHVKVLQECFDFEAIKKLFERKDFTFCYDALCGVQGPYAKKVFVDMLGCPEAALINCDPKEDFGGPSSAHHGHADPNLAHARALCDKMGVAKDGAPVTGQGEEPPSFGAAADGDADRNMILGTRFFVNPSDSLAVIVDNAEECIPYFKPQKGLFGAKGGLKGAARSMPTSCALDLVCKAKKIPCFETPTGWKFFGNLMDTPKYTPFICGEESFGTGSNHIREKDGMWAVLAWLSILASKNTDPSKPLVTVQDIVESHWKTYGRNYYGRYDYEGVEKDAAMKMMAYLGEMIGKWPADAFGKYKLDKADSFEYLDPIDGSLSKNQGMRFIFTDGSRIVFRVSGTGVVGATIRMYLEKYEPATGDLAQMPLDVVKELADVAISIAKLQEFTGRDAPTLMT